MVLTENYFHLLAAYLPLVILVQVFLFVFMHVNMK